METSSKSVGARKDLQTGLMLVLASLGAGIATTGHATEGGIGRPITGMQVTPYAGIVPPTDDWIFSISSIYYEGSLGKSKEIPIAGTVSAGLNYHVSYNLLNAVKTWGITAGGWNFASSFGVPFQYTSVLFIQRQVAERLRHTVRRYLLYSRGRRVSPDQDRPYRVERPDICPCRRL